MPCRCLPVLLLVLLVAIVAVPAAGAADPAPPGATTGTVSGVTPTTAGLSASVTPNGGDTTYVFQYGTSSSYGLTTPAQDAGSGTSATTVTANLTNLTSATRYHYRVVATNAAGITRGADRTFTTARTATAPTLSTFSTKSITATGAVPSGRVNPQGLATTAYVEYGTTTAYGAQTATTALPASFASTSLAFPLSGLSPGTAYHYRVVATNSVGVTRSPDRAFRTPRAPTSVTFNPVASTVPWKDTITINGTVLGAAVGGIGLAIERSDFPFTTTWTPTNLTARSDGSFTTTVGPLYATTKFRVITRSPYAVASPWVTVMNRVTVGLKRVQTTRRTVTLAGSVLPRVPNGRATLQRRSPTGAWVRVARAATQSSGEYASRYRFRIARSQTTRRYRVVVVPNDGGAHVNGTSRQITIPGSR